MMEAQETIDDNVNGDSDQSNDVIIEEEEEGNQKPAQFELISITPTPPQPPIVTVPSSSAQPLVQVIRIGIAPVQPSSIIFPTTISSKDLELKIPDSKHREAYIWLDGIRKDIDLRGQKCTAHGCPTLGKAVAHVNKSLADIFYILAINYSHNLSKELCDRAREIIDKFDTNCDHIYYHRIGIIQTTAEQKFIDIPSLPAPTLQQNKFHKVSDFLKTLYTTEADKEANACFLGILKDNHHPMNGFTIQVGYYLTQALFDNDFIVANLLLLFFKAILDLIQLIDHLPDQAAFEYILYTTTQVAFTWLTGPTFSVNHYILNDLKKRPSPSSSGEKQGGCLLS